MNDRLQEIKARNVRLWLNGVLDNESWLIDEVVRLRAALTALTAAEGELIQWMASRLGAAGWQQFGLGENPHHDAWLNARKQAAAAVSDTEADK